MREEQIRFLSIAYNIFSQDILETVIVAGTGDNRIEMEKKSRKSPTGKLSESSLTPALD